MSTAVNSSLFRLLSSNPSFDSSSVGSHLGSKNCWGLRGSLGFSSERTLARLAMSKRYVPSCSGDRDRDGSTSAMVDGIADCLDDVSLGLGGKQGGEGDLRLSVESIADLAMAASVGNDRQQRKKREQGRSPVEERERREADGGSGRKRSRGWRRQPAMAVVRRERVVGWLAAMGNADKATMAVLVK